MRAEPPISASPRRVRKTFERAGVELSDWEPDPFNLGFRFSILERRPHMVDGAPQLVPRDDGGLGMETRPFVIGSIIVSEMSGSLYGDDPDVMWLHASMAYVLGRDVPSYAEIATLKEAVFGPNRYAYMVFASEKDHVNHHVNALHLYGRRDGARVLPDFRIGGMI